MAAAAKKREPQGQSEENRAGLKLYLSADLEGVCGVVSPHQCSPEPDRAAYDRAVLQLQREITTVVEAAFATGDVAEILVNDSHCSMTNLDWSSMPSGVSLVSGKPKRLAMTAGLDASFDGMILLGYHARAGALKGVLSHTFHHRLFDVQINGISYGEAGINALHASLTYGVPLILASGDRALREELAEILPSVATVETKVGLTQTAAECHAWAIVEQEYREKIMQIFAAGPLGWQQNHLPVTGPFELGITFLTPLAADTASLIPGSTRLDGRTIQIRTEDFQTAYRYLQASYTILAATASLESY